MRDITVKILNNVEGKLLQLHIAQTGYPLYDMLWENGLEIILSFLSIGTFHTPTGYLVCVICSCNSFQLSKK
jgi:hypothetical protein